VGHVWGDFRRRLDRAVRGPRGGRQRPSFFKDLQFLLIGPLWLLAAAYRRFSVPY